MEGYELFCQKYKEDIGIISSSIERISANIVGLYNEVDEDSDLRITVADQHNRLAEQIRLIQDNEVKLFELLKRMEEYIDIDVNLDSKPIYPIQCKIIDSGYEFIIKGPLSHRPKYISRRDLAKKTINYSYIKHSYLRSFDSFFKKHPIYRKLNRAIMMFEYHCSNPMDVDNYDTKIIQDCISNKYMEAGDNPSSLSVYNKVIKDQQSYIKVYLIDKDNSEVVMKYI